METSKENTLRNRVIIETNHGERSFFLVEGDLLLDDGNLMVVNSYENEYGETTGDFVDLLNIHFDVDFIKEKPVFFLENGGYISLVETLTNKGLDKRMILILHSKLEEGKAINRSIYESLIKGLFSALTSLELTGYKFESVSFPVLLRKGLNGIYNEAAEVLIKYAVEWLKKSIHTNTIRYYVFHHDEVELWNKAIEYSLGRSIVYAKENEINILRYYILGLIYSFPKEESVYHDTLIPLQNALNRDQISPEIVAAFSRKLAESLCELITNHYDVSFDTNISTLKKNGNIDPIFIQCLYQIKAFGNTSIHRSRPNFGTDKIIAEDLKILLFILKKLLIKYEEILVLNRVLE
ncbi:DUF4145 domain-containing protein [Metabacillus bambusae]|uniref:DUF4145 domain-containing protein n=1 Tax=Metabacillus bambusae TaxID=2795218 RepID=A0ABS3N7T3_9BACI|nr:DUF4145 domain-containing protein [Metabacillus bambusae]MBO1514350.1 DUF4145 domain-containing protein [Metabacillus bambusae]